MGFLRFVLTSGPSAIVAAIILPALCTAARAQDDRRGSNPYFPTNLQPAAPAVNAPAAKTDSSELIPMPDQEKPPYRYAVPDRLTIAKADRLMKHIFATDYGDTRPSAQRTLAIKLLRQAYLTSDDPPMKYVLFRESRDIAVAAGYVETALQASIGWAVWFQLDPLPLEMETVKRASDAVRAPAAVASLVQACIGQARRDALKGDAEASSKFCEAA